MITNRLLGQLTDCAARTLIAAADAVASRSRVPNPVAATRVLLDALSDQTLSGGDIHESVTYQLDSLGFTWPEGRCVTCETPVDSCEIMLCDACEDWVCACSFENSSSEVSCGGCHLTRAGQGPSMPPCGCGCDTSFGKFGDYDTEGSVSRQHFIDTGRFLRPGEALDG